MSVFISHLISYPIKSCAGIGVEESAISAAGLQWDRQWVVVDAIGNMLTQRTVPTMVLIQPHIDKDYMVLSAPNQKNIAINLHTQATSAVAVQIWQDATYGSDEGDEVAAWFSQFLEQPCRLLRVHNQARRTLSKAWIRQWQKASSNAVDLLLETHFGFADGFPFLICNEDSLTELNETIVAEGDKAIEMSRFRPNIVVQGLEAYEEDYALGFYGGGHYFAKLKNCTRCPMPNVDPTNAEVGAQPALALVKTRRTAEGIIFGVNAALYQPSEQPTIQVGLKLEVDLSF